MVKVGIVERLQALLGGAPDAPVAEVPQDGPALRKLRKDVCAGLMEGMQPLLQAEGFSRFVNGTAWRDRERWVDVVQIQFIRNSLTTPHSPSLHVGRLFTFMPERLPDDPVRSSKGRYRPMPEQCHIRKTIFKPLRDRHPPDNIWPIGAEGEGLELCIAQAVALTQSQIVPWCLWLDDLTNAFALVHGGDADRDGISGDPLLCGVHPQSSVSHAVLSAMIAVQLKRWAVADKLLTRILSEGGIRSKDGRLVTLPPQTRGALLAAHQIALAQLQ
jgi:hypothetical protein